MMNFPTRVVLAVLNWIMSYSHLVRPVRTTLPYSRTINRTKTLTFALPNFENKKDVLFMFFFYFFGGVGDSDMLVTL